MKILAFDPGKNEFAWALINSSGRFQRSGFIADTITTMTPEEIRDQIVKFGRAISKVLDAAKPDQVWIERMQHRPHMGGGAVVEYMNVMIGIVMRISAERQITIYPVRPVDWKHHFAKLYGINIKERPFTTLGQKMQVRAPRGATRTVKGREVPLKNVTTFIPGILDDQAKTSTISIHEADAVAIACYGWYRSTGLNIIDKVLT